MTMRNAVHIPDHLWESFRRGTDQDVDHFIYHSPTPDQSIAVYADGRREEFDSTVTDEHVVQRQREEDEFWRNLPGRRVLRSTVLTIAEPKFHRQIVSIE